MTDERFGIITKGSPVFSFWTESQKVWQANSNYGNVYRFRRRLDDSFCCVFFVVRSRLYSLNHTFFFNSMPSSYSRKSYVPFFVFILFLSPKYDVFSLFHSPTQSLTLPQNLNRQSQTSKKFLEKNVGLYIHYVAGSPCKLS